MIGRREFISGLGAAGRPHLVRAQQQTTLTIVWLDSSGAPVEFVEGFRRGLAESGFSVRRDVMVEYHTTEGHSERLPALAADLVRRRPAAIIAIRYQPEDRQGTRSEPAADLVGDCRSGDRLRPPNARIPRWTVGDSSGSRLFVKDRPHR